MSEAVREPLNAREAIVQIGTHIETYLNGGPDRGAEDVELARQHGLNTERIEAQWAEARQAFFILPDEQSRVENPKEDSVKEKPKVGAVVDVAEPYEVARRFLIDRSRVDGVATL